MNRFAMKPVSFAQFSKSRRNRAMVIAACCALLVGNGCPGEEAGVHRANLFANATFENGTEGWKLTAWREKGIAEKDDQKTPTGHDSIRIESPIMTDSHLTQEIAVKPQTLYRLSGWIKTENVVKPEAPKQRPGEAGACLAISGGYDKTPDVFGTKDWTFVTVDISSKARSKFTVGPRLGFYGKLVTGTAWFTDVSLVELGPAPAEAPRPARQPGIGSSFVGTNRGPIADADPAVREEREVLAPDGFRTARNAEVLAFCEHAGPLKPIKLMVGHKMVLGMYTKLYIYPEGGERPAQPLFIQCASGTPQRVFKNAFFYYAEPFGFLQRGKPYVVEMDLAIFETDIPPGHMWSPEGKNYKVLWQTTLRQTPKEERELPPDLQADREHFESIKAQPVPLPEMPAEFLSAKSEAWSASSRRRLPRGSSLRSFPRFWNISPTNPILPSRWPWRRATRRNCVRSSVVSITTPSGRCSTRSPGIPA